MNDIIREIEGAVAAVEARLKTPGPADTPEALRIEFLGRNGLFPALSKKMGTVSPDERRATGTAFNEGRLKITALIEAALDSTSTARQDDDALDITLPGRRQPLGHKHPVSKIADECVAIFRKMGFTAMEGPEIEDIYHNFDALNTPMDHPSRDPQDTFYFPDGRILRSQTSPVQIRVMEALQPPIRIIAPGRVFRRDTPDATHGANFHQLEGLCVDKEVSMADLKSVLQQFACELYGEKVKIRLRPHFFPFTEPSVEYDFSCVVCGGKGCATCKNSGWIEIAGAGMVDPNVFKNVGYAPDAWTGFAFGLGIERLAMLRYRIPDLRLLYDNDVRFLEQF